jgi:hypothetical protein
VSDVKGRTAFVASAFIAVVILASVMTRPRPTANASGERLLEGAEVDAAVLAILDRSCRDCHSDTTKYPWYSYVAPVSVLINDDVKRGREHLNLSEWQAYSIIRRQRALSEIANQVKDRGMPLSMYLLLHPSAKLSDADIETVFNWTQRERLRLIATQQ